MFQKVVIVSAVRTAVGSFGGSLKTKSTVELGISAVRAAIERAGISAGDIEEVVLGCVGQYGLNPFLARLVAVKAGCAETSTGQTVNRLCASGLQAIVTAALAVEHGDAQIAVGGGAESMSNFPYSLPGARWGMRMGVNSGLRDDLTTALCEPFTGPDQHIAITAENIATRYSFSREEIDSYALESQRRAKAAIAAGKFQDEIVPVEIKTKKESFVFDTDEHPRETSMEKLAKLRPIVKPDGVVTAGNASGINDAAAALVVMSCDKAEELGCKPIARVVDYAVSGVDPQLMGLGPVASTRKLLNKTGMKLEDFGVVELNEAFASQAMGCIRELGLDPERVNPNGSGISLGHPIGATGAVITVKLLSELRRRGEHYGLATLCIGGGQGMSVAFELL